MKLIVGLGNPGQEYHNTKHNLGFMVLDRLSETENFSWKSWGKHAKAELAQTSLNGEKCIFLKPMTFMNLSGRAVVEAAHFFKILPEDILVVHDELDLEVGTVRLKKGGGEGGHNGLKSISASLSTKDYRRIRLGIGKPSHPEHDTSDHVLSRFSPNDLSLVEDMIERASSGVIAFIQGEKSFSNAMNTLNQKTRG